MHDASPLRQAIIRYFPAEKRESLLFIIVGLTATAIAALLIARASPYAGIAYPLAAVGLVQLIIGGTVYLRTDRRISELLVGVDADPAGTARRERERMSAVRRGFVIYRWTEVGMLAAGIVGLVLLQDGRFLRSIAIGLAVQAGSMLLLDIVAERRAARYVAEIEAYEATRRAAPEPGAALEATRLDALR